MILRKRVRPQVQEVVADVQSMLAKDGEIFFDEAVQMVAGRLKSIDQIVKEVRDTEAYGDSPAEIDWYRVLATWIVENQLGPELCWDAGRKIARRPK